MEPSVTVRAMRVRSLGTTDSNAYGNIQHILYLFNRAERLTPGGAFAKRAMSLIHSRSVLNKYVKPEAVTLMCDSLAAVSSLTTTDASLSFSSGLEGAA
jgi:hypothetical protein